MEILCLTHYCLLQRGRQNENNFDHVYTLHALDEGSARRLRELDDFIGKCSHLCEAVEPCLRPPAAL